MKKIDKLIELPPGEQPELRTIVDISKLSDNPFLASLQIKVNNISDYDAITSFLGDGSYKSMINKVSYNELRRIMGSNGK